MLWIFLNQIMIVLGKLHQYQCLELFFPLAFEDIDWTRGFEFLDKELQKAMLDVEIGCR